MIWNRLIVIAGIAFSAILVALPAPQFGGRGGAIGIDPQRQVPGNAPAAAPASTVSVQPPSETDPDTVTFYVSVTGKDNNAVPGIARDRFQIFEDGDEQKVSYFWEDSRPMTVGFLFDDSRRMDTNDKILVLKDAAQAFLKGKGADDEFFLARMASLANVATSFTTQVSNLPVNYIPSGETFGLALYDTIYMGLSVIKEGANPRKILVVVTSGGDRCCSDDHKTTKEDQLKAYALKQEKVQIYTLFVVDQIEDGDSEMVHRDAIVLGDLASMTGGRMYNAPNAARAVEAQMAELARGLKTQYLVGFKSTRPHDGKRRGLRVKVNSPEGSQKLSVWTKAQYYSPRD